MDNWVTRALVAAHTLAVVAKWAAVPAVFVHAFTWGGSTAVGVVSLAVLVPLLSGASLVGATQTRWPTLGNRVGALAVQVVGYGAAAVAAALGAPTPVVAPLVVLALCAFMLIPPTTAALLPHVTTSAAGMVRANLWVTHGDSVGSLLGALAAAPLLAIAGPAAALGASGCCVAIGLVASMWRADPYVRSARTTRAVRTKRYLRRTMVDFVSHPWGRAVSLLLSARSLMYGAFDVLLVIVAIDSLDLGEAGPAYLDALAGIGALVSTLVTTQVVRRARLRGALGVVIVFATLATIGLGLRLDRPIVFVALPLIGMALAAVDALSRTLMIRTTDPRKVAPLYGSLSFLDGVVQVAGSVIAQVMLAVGDIELAFLVLGAVLASLTVGIVASLRQAEEHAEIPVVEMALLSEQPMLSALPTEGLERVAATAEAVDFSAGEHMTTEGDYVDACYVVLDGAFEVTARKRQIASVGRGDVLGEVALLSRITSATSVVAVEDATALRIARQDFCLALTGYEASEVAETPDLADARSIFREVIAARERIAESSGADRPDIWLGLGATGRLLGDPLFTAALARGARMAEGAGNDAAVAEAAALAIYPGAFFGIADNPDHEMIELCEKALAILSPDDPLRVRVLAALASNLAFAAPLERRRELIEEAHRLAEAIDDPLLTGAVLNAEFISMWEPQTLERRAEIGPALADIGRRSADLEFEYLGRFLDAFCKTEQGRFDAARDDLLALREIAPATSKEYFEFLSERLLLSIDIARGAGDVRERIDALALRHADTYADTDGTWALQIGGLAYQDGTLGAMVPALTEMMEGPHWRTWRAALALAHEFAGNTESAMSMITELRGDALPKSYFWLTAMQTQAEVAANLGMVDRCRELYDELAPYADHVGITASGSRIFGLVSRSLGDLALVLDRHDEAETLLEKAVADADACGLVYEAVISRRMLAQTRHAIGSPDRAREPAKHALAAAVERGYTREAHLLEKLLAADPVEEVARPAP